MIVCATAAQLGDSYCSLAWGKTLAAEAGPASAAAVLAARESHELTGRDRALAAWARKVVADPNGTTESDIASLRAVGLADVEIFEVTAFIAFRLAFSSINDALGATPDWELVSTVPNEVGAVVTYGRRPESKSETEQHLTTNNASARATRSSGPNKWYENRPKADPFQGT